MWELCSCPRTWTRHWWIWVSSLTRRPSRMRQTQSSMCLRDIWNRSCGWNMARVISYISQVCGGKKGLWVTQPRTGVMMMMMMMNGNHDYDRCSCEKMVPWSSHGRNLCIKKLSRLKKNNVQIFSPGGIFPGKSRTSAPYDFP